MLSILFYNFLYINNQIKEMAVGIATNLTNQRKKNQQQMEKNISMMGINLSRIAQSENFFTDS